MIRDGEEVDCQKEAVKKEGEKKLWSLDGRLAVGASLVFILRPGNYLNLTSCQLT